MQVKFAFLKGASYEEDLNQLVKELSNKISSVKFSVSYVEKVELNFLPVMLVYSSDNSLKHTFTNLFSYF